MHSTRKRIALFSGCVGVCAMLVWSPGSFSAGGEKGGIKVKEGQPAPAVELPATQIETVFPGKKNAKTLKLADFKGKKNVVLYFFPKALTGG
jgi:hypothetical protein